MYKIKLPIDIVTLTNFLQENGLLQQNWWNKSFN